MERSVKSEPLCDDEYKSCLCESVAKEDPPNSNNVFLKQMDKIVEEVTKLRENIVKEKLAKELVV